MAASGTVIALSKGTHAVNGPLPREVTLWGACVGETTLSSTMNVPAIAYADGPGVEVKNLRISGLGSGARAIGVGASLRLSDVLIDGVDGVGWGAVDGASTVGTAVVVRNVRPAGTVSLGVASIAGATLDATRLVTQGLRGRALHVTATATVRDCYETTRVKARRWLFVLTSFVRSRVLHQVGDVGALRRRVTLLFAGCGASTVEPHDRVPSGGSAVSGREFGIRPIAESLRAFLLFVPHVARLVRDSS